MATKKKTQKKKAGAGRASAGRKKTAGKAKTKAKKAKTKAKKTGSSRKTAAAPKKKAPAKAKRKAAPKKAAAPARAKKTTKTTKKTARPKAKAAAKVRRRLSTRELNAFRKTLLEKQQSLLQAYLSAKGETRVSTGGGTEDYIDYAVSSYAQEFSLSLTEMERKQLLLVEEALRRLHRREFGRCLQCGNDIPLPRLQVEPWARHCIRCQELEEQGLLDEVDYAIDDGDAESGAGRPGDQDDESSEELDDAGDEDAEPSA